MSLLTHTHAISNPYDDFSKKHSGRALFNKTKVNEDKKTQRKNHKNDSQALFSKSSDALQ